MAKISYQISWPMTKPQHPIRLKPPQPPPVLPAHAVAGRNYNIEEAVEYLLRQSSDVKEGRRVTLII
jgi:hypothetical protein